MATNEPKTTTAKTTQPLTTQPLTPGVGTYTEDSEAKLSKARSDDDSARRISESLDKIGTLNVEGKPTERVEPTSGPIDHTDYDVMRKVKGALRENISRETGLPRLWNRINGKEVVDRGELERVLGLMASGRNFDPFTPYKPANTEPVADGALAQPSDTLLAGVPGGTGSK